MAREDEQNKAPGYEFSSGYAPVFDFRDESITNDMDAKKRSIFRERDGMFNTLISHMK